MADILYGRTGIFSQIAAWISSENYFLRWRYFLTLAVVGWLYLILNDIKGVAIVGVLGVLASYSTVYRRVLRVPASFELVTLGTVVTSVAYGPLAGASFGIITTIASEIISSEVNAFSPLFVFARGLIGVLAFYLGFINIVLLGIAMVVLFNVITQSLRWLLGDIEQALEGVYFFATNAVCNFLAFVILGNFLLAMMA